MGESPSPLPPTAEVLRELQWLQIQLEPREIEQLSRYLARVLDANTRFNLTRITDPAQAWKKHILDSLTLLPLIESARAKTVIDVGSGAGLPGVPLAIAMPSVQFTLLEATGKKARFLELTAEALGLANVTVLNERAETLGRDAMSGREKFDIAIARAVGPLPVVLELMMPLIKPGGIALAVKGAKARAEVKAAAAALRTLDSEVVDLHPTPTGTIVIVRKLGPTPTRYPRRPGEPQCKPLR